MPSPSPSPTAPPTGPPSKPKKKRPSSVWDAAQWRPVEVATHLTSADDGSFAGLEELSGAEARVLLAGLNAAAPQPSAPKKAKPSKPSSKPSPSTDDLAARVRALEAENKRLKAAVAEGKKKKAAKPLLPPAHPAAPPPPTPPPKAAVSVAAWEPCGLGPELLGVLSTQGFSGPTPIQALALPPALAGRRDVLGAAPTGSGKTLAYGLAILQRLIDERAARGGREGQPDDTADPSRPPPPSRLRALILCPTRELALQVAGALDPFARAARVRVAPVVGGLAAPKQARLLAAGPAVVVATPGRLWAEVEGGHPHLGTPAALGGLAALVIDEADRMVADGSFPDLAAILARVEGALATKRAGGEGGDGGGPPAPLSSKAARAAAWAGAMQTFVFSATLTLPAALRRRVKAGGKGGGAGKGGAGLEALVQRVPLQPGRSPAVVDVGGRADAPPADPTPTPTPAPAPSPSSYLAPGIEEAVVQCADGPARDAALYYLLAAHGGKALVFVNAVSSARRLAGLLSALALPARSLHAGMQQRARLKALDRFASDGAGILVATDVAARGLDVAGIRTVIHYQVPATPDTYVHRCGRTARGVDAAGGLAVSLVVPSEAARFEGLMRALGRGGGGGRDPPPPFPIEGRLLAAASERVALAAVVDAASAKAARARADDAWRRRAAADAGVALSDDDDDDDDDEASDASSGDEDGGAPAKKRRGGGVQPLPPAAEAARARLAGLLARPLSPGGGGRGGPPQPRKATPPSKPTTPRKPKPLSVAERRAAALAAAVAKRTGGARAKKLAKGAGRISRPGRLVVPPAAGGRMGAVVGAVDPLAALQAARGGGGGGGG